MPVAAWIAASSVLRVAVLITLFGTNTMSSAWSVTSVLFAARILSKGMGISVGAPSTLRISLADPILAVGFVPWAMAMACRTVKWGLSRMIPVGSFTSPTTYTIPALET